MARRLRAQGPERHAAVAALHALLLRASRFEVGRRRAARSHLGRRSDDLARQSPADALMTVLGKLDTYAGAQPLHDLGLQFALTRRPRRCADTPGGTRAAARAEDVAADRRRPATSHRTRARARAVRRGVRSAWRADGRTSAGCWSRSPSTTSRSTCSSTARNTLAARCTRRCTIPAAGWARCSPPTASRSPESGSSSRSHDAPDQGGAVAAGRFAGPELTCAQCFDQLDRYVELELELGGSDADTAVPGMRAHLEGCPACAEDHDSLRELLLSEGPGGR